jgi:hypothetical protein
VSIQTDRLVCQEKVSGKFPETVSTNGISGLKLVIIKDIKHASVSTGLCNLKFATIRIPKFTSAVKFTDVN